MLAYACQLGQKALKVGNYIIYFPVYLDTPCSVLFSLLKNILNIILNVIKS